MITIINKTNKNKRLTFDEVPIGECYVRSGNLYIKVDSKSTVQFWNERFWLSQVSSENHFHDRELVDLEITIKSK